MGFNIRFAMAVNWRIKANFLSNYFSVAPWVNLSPRTFIFKWLSMKSNIGSISFSTPMLFITAAILIEDMMGRTSLKAFCLCWVSTKMSNTASRSVSNSLGLCSLRILVLYSLPPGSITVEFHISRNWSVFKLSWSPSPSNILFAGLYILFNHCWNLVFQSPSLNKIKDCSLTKGIFL